MNLIIIIFGLFSLLFPACGKKTAPIPPNLIIPRPVGQLDFLSRPEAVFLVWSVPDRNVDGSPLKDLKGFRIYRNSGGPASEPVDLGSLKFEKLAEIDYEFPVAARAEGDKITFADKNVLPGNQYFYYLRAFNRRGYQSPPSPTIRVSRVPALASPLGLSVSPGDRWIQLTWQPFAGPVPGGQPTDLTGYNLYRSGEKESLPFLPVNPEPITRTVYTDLGLENHRTYYYWISALEKVNGTLNESLPSSPVSAVPEDRVPPLPPQGLTAVLAPSGVELRWEPNAEKDLAGYLIYRGKGPEYRMGSLAPAPVTETIFLDREVKRGQAYRYHLTAVDSAPARNESEDSEPANIRVPQTR